MDEPNSKRDISSLEVKIASELNILLNNCSIGSDLEIKPPIKILYLLELYIPRLLSQKYLEWDYESLDGFYLSNARKISAEAVEFSGLCILISDQTVTPFAMYLELNSFHDLIASYQVLLGESGGGSLGISGPSCNSAQAEKLLKSLPMRLNTILWSYRMTLSSN
jgi:hypothetical protein